MSNDQVVLVDTQDVQVGLMDKLEAHRGFGLLHRAVSVLLYRQQNGVVEVLLQQRSTKKPLWPLFWSNTICTHPRDEEKPVDCAVRRLQEEMGISLRAVDLGFLFTLLYQARYNEELSENELDHVFVGLWNGELFLNDDEAAGAKWVEWNVLQEDMRKNELTYTPWFHLLVQNDQIQKLLSTKI